MPEKDENWYIVIERQTMSLEAMEPIVIGPFKDEDKARTHMHDSMDVEDWCYGEAKAKQYIVDDVYMKQDVATPSYGYNAPVSNDDETQWIPLGGRKTRAQ